MKFRYRNEEEMKDSGVEWLGNIPDKWELLKLRNLGNITTSSVDKKIDEKEGMVKLVNYVDIYNSKTKELYNNSEYMNVSAKEKQIETCDLIKGDVLFTPSSETINDIGYSAVVMEDLKNTLYSYHIVRLRFIKNINLNFKKYIFWSNSFLNYLSSRATGTTRKTLSLNDFKSNCVVVPNINEQEKIARFLDEKTAEFDLIISKKEALIERLEEAKKSLISEVVTGKVKVMKTSDGYELVERKKEEMKESGIKWVDEIPKDYKLSKIKYLADITRGKFNHRPRNDPEYYGGLYPFIQTGDVAKAKMHIKDYSQTLNEKGYNVSKEFKRETLVMTIAANIGDVAILGFDACFPDSIIGFVPNKKIKLEYMYYLFKCMKDEFMSTAILNTQLNLNVERVENLLAIVPSLHEQDIIVNYISYMLNEVDSKLLILKKQIEKLRKAKKSLISEVVTGKIEVLE